MIAVKLDSDIAESFSIAGNHPILKEICSAYRFDSNYLFIPEERFTSAESLEKIISEGLAFRT
ncbi:MAG: hypothetical protein HQ522_02105 [Bacteroidetes bacterium]|nr:hypothetical protein [Bacteroidota bacterium]